MSSSRVSVAMAVYNGEKYLRDQLDSIISQLGNNDELVISYDVSSDHSLEIIEEYSNSDKRVKWFSNTYKPGVSGNFTNAAIHCSGEYIFFSDQDDIWVREKIDTMVSALESTGADLVIHDGFLTDSNLNPYEKSLNEINKATTNPIMNYIKGRYLGCCMAFRNSTMRYILPFPDITRDFPHDIFATIMVGIKGSIVSIPDKLILHRLHETNETPKTRNPLYKVLFNRVILLIEIIKRLVRKNNR